ncbi:MAG: SpoIIE family protein phosphatase [Gammaproteobacteria bacterium]
MSDAAVDLPGGEPGAGLLAALTQEFASTLDIDETLRHAVDRCLAHLGAEAGSIFLLEGERLVCRACAGPVDIRGLTLPAREGIVGQAVMRNEARMVRDVAREPAFAATVDAGTGFVTRSILCVPLAVRGAALGALELLNKRGGDGRFGGADLELATTVAAAAALAIHNARMAAALVQQERVKRELELARQIQESLLPAPRDGGFAVHGRNLPAHEVSGDFFDFMPLADGRVYFCIADVAGKGMNAALLMARTLGLLRCLARRVATPGALLAEVNAELCETTPLGLFVTAVAGFFEPASGVVEFANAGHPPPLLHAAEGDWHRFAGSAPPLGVVDGQDFPAQRLTLAGGALYLYTDGLSESRAREGALGASGLERLATGVAPLGAPLRLDALLGAWRAAGYAASDDVTLLVVDGATTTGDAACLLRRRLLATPTALAPLRAESAAALRGARLAPRVVDELVLAVNEATCNVIQHAYRAAEAGEIVVQISNNGREIEILIVDFAAPAPVSDIAPRALADLRPGGLGTHFMQTLTDHCTWRHLPGGTGNVLRMTRSLADIVEVEGAR